MEDLDAYYEKLIIDKNELDLEVERQPQYYSDVCRNYAEALSLRDLAKDNLAAIVAGEAAKLRSDEDHKWSEAAIDKELPQKVKYKIASREYIQAKKLAAQWEGMKEAWHQRSFMLGHMAELYSSDYFTAASTHKGSIVKVQHTQLRERSKTLHKKISKKRSGIRKR